MIVNDSLSWRSVLGFWFGEPGGAEYGRPRENWFKTSPAFDEEIHRRFGELHVRALKGEPDTWSQAPESALALLIVLDQFSRNLHRGTAQAFAADGKALALAQRMVAQQWDQAFLPVQRQFVYLPFEHAEDMATQNEAIRLFEQLREDSTSEIAIDYAYRHRAVIERFGRFPHRNAILGRSSTDEELAFLKQPGSSF